MPDENTLEIILKGDAGYDRTLLIELVKDAKCSVCGKNDRALVADDSDGEYSGIALCLPCLRVVTRKLEGKPNDTPGEVQAGPPS